MRANYAHGPDHWKFVAYVGLTLGFLYLGVSSFWQMVIKGMVIIAAVVVDQAQRKLQQRAALQQMAQLA